MSDTRTRWGADFVLILLLGGIIIAQGLVFHWGPVDDAFISMRYARNWADGAGLVFNPGERVEGYTNFLWTAMLAGAARTGLDLVRVATVLGVLFAILTLWLTVVLARQLAAERGWPTAIPWAAAILLAAYPGWAFWAFSGMEGPLLAALVTAYMALGFSRSNSRWRIPAMALVGIMAALTRWEAVLIWPIPIIAGLADPARAVSVRVRSAVLLAVSLLLGFAVYYALRFHYYGDFLPNTFYAKMGWPLRARLPRGLAYFGEMAINWGLPVTAIIWLAGGKGLRSMCVLLTLGLYVLYVVWTGGDFFPWLRFLLPVLPLAAIFAADAIACLERGLGCAAEAPLCRRAGLITAGALLIFGIGLRIDYEAARGQLGVVQQWKAVGLWARLQLPAGTRLAVAPIGAIGYYSDHPILDTLGLTDREIARDGQVDLSEPPGHQRSNVQSVIRRLPDFVLGQANLFPVSPEENQAIEASRRRSLQRLLRAPEFRGQYKYETARIGHLFLPYWVRTNPARPE